jgi:hypothetical protein
MFAAIVAASVATCEVDRLELSGFSAVKPVVVDELLPRALPTCLREEELAELERRVWSLGLFDDVKVERRGRVVRVTVREKWTLIPIPDFGTAKRLVDSYGSLTLTEANLAGRAVECDAWVAYYARAWSGQAWCGEHQAHARQVSFEGSAGLGGTGMFFDDSPRSWERRQVGASIGVRLPFWYGSQWRFSLSVEGSHERAIGDVPANLARSGVQLGWGAKAIWDRFSWNDLTPSGHRFVISGRPGVFLRSGRDRPRHALSSQWLSAWAFGGRAVVLLNAVAEAASPGDPNHGYLLGSVPSWRSFLIGGIRGLSDYVNHDAFHAYANLEGRVALQLGKRWYLQGVAFADGGALSRIGAEGEVQPMRGALSLGVGLRVLPTFLTWIAPRIDAGRAFAPAPSWFFLAGLSQYF